MSVPVSPSGDLRRLLAMVDEALALSDALGLDMTGIALDTARLSIEEALAIGEGATKRAASAG